MATKKEESRIVWRVVTEALAVRVEQMHSGLFVGDSVSEVERKAMHVNSAEDGSPLARILSIERLGVIVA